MQILDAPLSPNEYQTGHADDSEKWEMLYPLLHARVARWVCSTRIPLWTYQRKEVIEDIVQDALLRTVAYMRRAERGEARMVDSLESMSIVTAYHCYVDSLRRDRHLIPLSQEADASTEYLVSLGSIELQEQEQESPLDRATEAVYSEDLFTQVAHEVAHFPLKQRDALLIDLANRMYFDPYCLTPLQQAFADAGIHLQEYRRPLPTDRMVRARHAAHLSLAYKRLAALSNVRLWSFVA